MSSGASRRSILRMPDVGRAWTIGRRFLPELAPHKRALGAVAVLSLTSVAVELLRPWPIQWIFDHALLPKSGETRTLAFVLWTGIGAIVLLSLLRAALDFTGAVMTHRVGQAVSRSLRLRIFNHLVELSPSFHARHKSGDLLMRVVGDVPMLRAMMVDSSVALATRLGLILCTLGVMLWVDALLTLLVLAIAPVFLLITAAVSRRITAAARKNRKKEGRMADFMHEALIATPMLQSLGRVDHTSQRFARTNRSQARAEMKTAQLSAGLSALVESLFGCATAVALGLGSWRVVSGHLSPGELLVFLSYVRGLLKPARTTSKHSDRVSRGVACGERIVSILDESVEIVSRPGAQSAPLAPERLDFESVSFRYAEHGEAVTQLSLAFRRGSLCALFGESGSGKSTVAALALRLYDPEKGRVALDGIDVRDLELESLRARFGLSMQEPILFGDSIRENLLLGRPDASEADLWAACKAAAADTFIASLPAGLDTELGSAGVGLSGGERRRLCLARTLLRDAPIVVVDEPFAGLDRLAIDRVRATLSALAADRIVIVITHDLEHLDRFDEVVFLEHGRVRDRGTHAELVARSSAYRRITRASVTVAS